MKKIALILAGGRGSRAGSRCPKQMVELLGRRMLDYSIRAFTEYDPEMEIIVVIGRDMICEYADYAREMELPWHFSMCPGGATRIESSINGLRLCAMKATKAKLRFDDCVVAIHDAARPLIDVSTIGRVFDSVAKGRGVVPCVPAVNSLRRLEGDCADGFGASVSVRRSDYVEVQTPQAFVLSDLAKAYNRIIDHPEETDAMTDDASVAEAAGVGITLVDGDPYNMKVTYPMDFRIAATILRSRGEVME